LRYGAKPEEEIIWEGIELFRAKHNKAAVCGYQFVFAYTFKGADYGNGLNLAEVADILAKNRKDTHPRETEATGQLVQALKQFSFDGKEPIDRTWISSPYRADT
jgi:hypothetical protein